MLASSHYLYKAILKRSPNQLLNAKTVISSKAVAKRKALPKPRGDEDGAEEAKPKTLAEQVKAALVESLQLVQKARTSAITLFAADLCETIMKHAETVEGSYKMISKVVEKSPKDQVLQGHMKEVQDKDKITRKLQAGARTKRKRVGPINLAFD